MCVYAVYVYDEVVCRKMAWIFYFDIEFVLDCWSKLTRCVVSVFVRLFVFLLK